MSDKKPTPQISEASSLNIDGTFYKTSLNKKFERRTHWNKPDEKKLISFIPGTIKKVFVKKGQKVKKGEKILILEAMKMQNKILISQDGVIKQIHVKEGQIIPKGELMLELK
jgi:biotin carboxyl carrier protein